MNDFILRHTIDAPRRRTAGRRVSSTVSLLVLGLALGCSSDSKDDGTETPGSCAATVCPGSDDAEALQTALIEAKSGDTITLGPGTYRLSTSLSLQDHTDVTLKGGGDSPDDVLLDFSDQESGSEGILVTADGFTIENLSIKNTRGNGIKVQADDSVFRRIKVGWDEVMTSNGAYAIYPTGCKNTLMEDNEVYGASDAGIYAGQCENVIARRNKAYKNVLGIEIENTTNADVYDNEVYDNTCGFLLDLLPNLEKKTQGSYLVRDNDVHDNNLPNFAEENTVAAMMPRGTGLLVLAASDIEIRNNTFTNNQGAAVSIVSYDIVDVLSESPAAPDPATNRYPERVYVHDNTYSNNGTDPTGGAYEIVAEPADGGKVNPYAVIWDGKLKPGTPDDAAAQICLGAPEKDSFLNFELDSLGDLTKRSTDPTPHLCTLPPVPELTLP